MNNRILRWPAAPVILGVVMAITACMNPMRNIGGSRGSLTVAIADRVSRTLLPADSMVPASYDLEGSGPGGASFSLTLTGESQATFDHLAFGTWSVTVTAYNADGIRIGAGSGSVEVHTNQSSTLPITVSPFDGLGTLSLDLSWPASEVEAAQVVSQLIPASGAARDLTFNVNPAAGTAEFSADDVASGYHALTLKLLDNGALTMGAVEVVRIVADQTTSGSFTFSPINHPGGTLEVDITPELDDPLTVSIGGASGQKGQGDTMALSASNSEGVNAVYLWYVNGEQAGSGESFSFDDSWAIGHYRIDVTAFSTDGLRAGSASTPVDVVEQIAPPSGTIVTVAGTGSYGYSGDGGTATDAQLSFPQSVAVDGSGNVYVADYGNQRIRKVDRNGTITTLAGNGTQGYSGDGGPAVDAEFAHPTSVAVDGAGNVYIADWENQRVRKVDTNGVITTVAGNGTDGYSGDGGPAIEASLSFARGIAVDEAGNVYIADTNNNRIRKVDTSGTIATIAGSAGQGHSGDGGPAVDASLSLPDGVAVDGEGNVYIADSNNNCIRKVDADGTITTIAGDGTRGYSGDGGLAVDAELFNPYGVTVDAAGHVYIADTGNLRVRMVDSDGTITTVAGTGTSGYLGDGGPAVDAHIGRPTDVAANGAGNLYIADPDNNSIREVLQ